MHNAYGTYWFSAIDARMYWPSVRAQRDLGTHPPDETNVFGPLDMDFDETQDVEEKLTSLRNALDVLIGKSWTQGF